VSDPPKDDDPKKEEARAGLVLLKSKAAKRRPRRRTGEGQPSLRLIDCRPSLFELLARRRVRLPLREAAERSLGRFAALVAAKFRR
jgi:hypothetical protein